MRKNGAETRGLRSAQNYGGKKEGLRKRTRRDEGDRQAAAQAGGETWASRVNTMQLETKFLRLPTPGTLDSRFGDWQVTWLGGWSRHRLYYLVMVVRLKPSRITTVANAKRAARKDGK